MRDLWFIVKILAVSLIALLVLNHFGYAAGNTTNGSYMVILDIPEPSHYNTSPYDFSHPYRIQQGQAVYINDTIDISGMGWGTGVAYYGKYAEYNQPVYIRIIKDYKESTRFYIDPELFKGMPGMWYQYYGGVDRGYTESRGNLEAFFVKEGYRNSTLTFPNGTIVNQSVGISKMVPLVIPREDLLPEVRVADYLLAIGDPLPIGNDNKTQVWVFGRVDGIYGTTDTTIPASDFLNFEPGAYTMLVQYAGTNTEFDVRYNNGALQYQSGWEGVKTDDVSPLQPRMILDHLKLLLNKTDDTYAIKSLEVQQPVITINQMDEVWLASKAKEYNLYEGDVSFMDVRGYTNLQNQTNISVVLDSQYITEREKGRYSTFAETRRSTVGNQTQFRAYVPIIWDNMALGIHTITASGPFGTYVNADFPVEILPADSFRPNATIKYAGNRSPWVPTPTPLVKTVNLIQTVRIVERITIPVTPSNEQVYEQQNKALWDSVTRAFGLALVLTAMVCAGLGLLWAFRMYKRAKE